MDNTAKKYYSRHRKQFVSVDERIEELERKVDFHLRRAKYYRENKDLIIERYYSNKGNYHDQTDIAGFERHVETDEYKAKHFKEMIEELKRDKES